MSARRVAIYRTSLLPRSETFVAEQARALARFRPLLMGRHAEEGGLAIADLPSVTAFDRARPTGRALERVDGFLERRLGHSPRTLQLLARAAPDLVHAHFGTDAARVWPAASALLLPLVVTLHGYDITIDERVWRAHPGAHERAYPDRLRALAAAPAVHFVAVSEAMRQKAIARGIPSDKVTVSYIGVDVARFRPSGLPLAARRRAVLFVGRLVEKKGVAYLIDAFARVQAAIPDAELIILGDGPLRAELDARAARQAVHASFLGGKDSAGVAHQLAEARVFCLPSVVAASGDGEGLGIALLEAQAAGVPVVTSAQGGRDEAIRHGQTGFAFRERDVATLAHHLTQLLSDDALCARLGAAARTFVCTHFDLARCTDRLEDVYERAAYACRAPQSRALAARLLGGGAARRRSPNTP